MRPTVAVLSACAVLASACAQQPVEPPAPTPLESVASDEPPDGEFEARIDDDAQHGRADAASAAASGDPLSDAGERIALGQGGLSRTLASVLQRRTRVWRVGSRLRTGGAPLCDDAEYTYGFLPVDRATFGAYWKGAAEELGLEPGIRIWAVREDVAAAAGLLTPGDRILAVDGRPVADLDSFERRMSDPRDDGVLAMTVERASGEIVDVALRGVRACEYDITSYEDSMVGMFVRGRDIYITNGLIRWLHSDDELAVLLAHEMAHDSLGHVTRKQIQAVAGLLAEVAVTVFTGFGTGGALARPGENAFAGSMETKADVLGLYILARAGYDPSTASDLWTRSATELPIDDPAGILMSHPISPERVHRTESVSRDIERKVARGAALVPTDDAAGGDEQALTAAVADDELVAGVVTVVPLDDLLPVEADGTGFASGLR